MSKQPTSVRLPDLTISQLAKLITTTGMTQSEIFATAIDRMYQQEIQSMTTQTETITIGKITTQPEHDPYTNIEGITSRTYLKLDPRDRSVWVTQEYNDNSTPSDEWHGLVLTWPVPNHPLESAMREWIEEHMPELQRICAGYESVWNGNNRVGQLSDDARATKDAIEFELDNDAGPADYYEVWTVESWLESSLSEVTADMSDEQLADMASALEPDSGTVVIGSILDYLTQHRDNLKADADADEE